MIGTTLSKTEVVQIAVLEIIILHDNLITGPLWELLFLRLELFIFSTKDRNDYF